MALIIDIEARDGITSVVSDIEERFRSLEERAGRIGTELADSLKGSLSGVQEAGNRLTAVMDHIEQLKAKLRESQSVRDELTAKRNSMTSEEHAQLLATRTKIKELTNEIKTETEALPGLKEAFKEAFKEASDGADEAEKSFEKQGKEAEKAAKATKSTKEEAKGLGKVFQSVGGKVAAAFSIGAMVGFAKKVVEVRGEMQSLQASFAAMLGSQEKAEQMMQEAVDFAATTPFDLKGVAASAKQLLAYGTEQENVIKDMQMLGNVAAGLSIPLNDLIYLYGTLQSQGRVMTIDIRQFAMRGIPIYKELAKVLKVNEDQVSAMVSAGRVGFKDVQQAFVNMTSEGGKFYGLIDGVSKTVKGRISNLGDSIYQLYNSIGEKTDGLIATVLSVASAAVENADKVFNVVWELIKLYGSYKAAVIAVNAATKASAALHAIETGQIVLKTRALRGAVKAKQALNALKLANPYVLIGAALAAVLVNLPKFIEKQKEAVSVEAQYNKLVARRKEQQEEENELFSKIQAAATDDARIARIDELIKKYPELLDKYKKEELYLMSIADLQEEVKAADDARDAAEIQSLQKQAAEADEMLTTTASWANYNSGYWEKRKATAEAALSAWYKIRPDLMVMGPYAPGGATSGGSSASSTTKNKSYWEKQQKEAKGKIEMLTVEELNSSEGKALIAEYQKATQELEKYTKATQNLTKAESEAEKSATKLAKAKQTYWESVKSYNEKLKSFNASIDASKNGEMDSFAQQSLGIAQERAKLEQAKEELGDLLQKTFGGNVDLKNRQIGNMQEAKVKDNKGKERSILVTPVLPDGSALSNEELQKYIKSVLSGSKDILKADTKKLVISVDTGDKESLANMKGAYDNSSSQIDSYISSLEAKNLRDLLGEYQDFDTKLKNLTEEYSRTKDALISGITPENREKVEKALEELEKVYREKFASLYDEVDANKMLDQTWIDSLKGKTESGLVQELASLENLFSILKEAGALSEGEASLMSGKIEYMSSLIDKFRNKTDKASTSWTDLHTVVSEVGSSISSLGDAIGGSFGEMLKTVGSVTTSIGQGITAIQGIKDATTSTEKFTAALSLAGAAMQVISTIASIVSSNAEALEKATAAAHDYANALKDIEFEAGKEALTNAFGSYDYSEFLYNVERVKDGINGAWASNSEYIKEYLFALQNAGETYESYTKYLEAYNAWNPQGVVKDISLSADMRSWWQKLWHSGENIETASLGDFFDEEGNLLGDKLKAWYDTYGGYLSDSQKTLVEDLLSSWEEYESAMGSVADYLSGLFDNALDGVAESMYDSFVSTGDALADLNDYAKSFAKNMAISVIKSQYLMKIFSQENQEKIGSLLAGGDISGAVSLFNSLLGQAEEMAPAITEFLEKLDLSIEDAEDSATAGGFETMSQDTATELNGRFTAIQISNDAILSFVREMNSALSTNWGRQMLTAEDIRNIQANALLELMDINDNTRLVVKPIQEMHTLMGKINDKVERL